MDESATLSHMVASADDSNYTNDAIQGHQGDAAGTDGGARTSHEDGDERPTGRTADGPTLTPN